MPSEYIMYLSIVMIGALAIAGISATMVGVNHSIENRATTSSLEQIIQKVAHSIIELNNDGKNQIEQGAVKVKITVFLDLPMTVEHKLYAIGAYLNEGSGNYMLRSYLLSNHDIGAVTSLYLNQSEVTVSGSFYSTSVTPTLVFNYNGTAAVISLVG